MKPKNPHALSWASLIIAATALSACGGGGTDAVPYTGRVHVLGDSLADVGTFFGVKATIQGNDMYPELVAKAYGLDKGCNYFAFTGTTFTTSGKSGCTNFAIGGGVINRASSGLSSSDPRVISVQIAAATAAGSYSKSDQLLIDGGGNDAAGLVGAYLKASSDGGAAYVAMLGTVLTSDQVSAAVAGGSAGLAAAGATYMKALADVFYAQIKAGVLDKGATRVALLNMPGITNTPRFQAVLDGISAAYGGGATGTAARAQSEALFKGWVEAFNAQLAAKFSGDARVAIVDFYSAFNAQVADPAKYGLTNAKTPACPVTGVGSDGLPVYDFPTCTDAALAAKPPAGVSGSTWYTRYAFSDGFHPTPYGHQLLGDEIMRTLKAVSWLY